MLITLLLVTACGRPLSTGESEFAATIFGPELQTQNVRVAPFPGLELLTQRIPERPRIACRELIWPAPETTDGMVETFTAAFVTFNRINMASRFYWPDYLPEYPDKISLPAAMLIGHELTHVWQWQNRARTGYHPLKAVSEQITSVDPYLLELDTTADFLRFPYEQQGAIVEEYICCRSLDPNGQRTRRLYDLLKSAMPVEAIENISRPEVILPWQEAETAGICS